MILLFDRLRVAAQGEMSFSVVTDPVPIREVSRNLLVTAVGKCRVFYQVEDTRKYSRRFRGDTARAETGLQERAAAAVVDAMGRVLPGKDVGEYHACRAEIEAAIQTLLEEEMAEFGITVTCRFTLGDISAPTLTEVEQIAAKNREIPGLTIIEAAGRLGGPAIMHPAVSAMLGSTLSGARPPEEPRDLY